MRGGREGGSEEYYIEGLCNELFIKFGTNLPFVGERVKLSLELALGDGLGVEHKHVRHLKWSPSRSELALQGREGTCP